MADRDLILEGSHTPSYEEIGEYARSPARPLWQDINTFIQQTYKSSPRITYSKCCAKPGWNVKYQKSGKSLCTLYPEKDGFVALVVILLDLVPIVEGISHEFEKEVIELIRKAKPFNGTLWLMVEVKNESVLQNVKQLLLLKQPIKQVQTLI